MNSINDLISRMLNPGALEAGGFSQTLLAIVFAYFGGVLASLTPCVYPMIPITVSVVGGVGQTRRAWHEVWIRGIGYVLGMAIIYSFLGVLAGLTGRVFGTFTNTPGWYLGLSAILTIAALMMMEVFVFDPAALWNRFKGRYFRSNKPHQPHHHAVQEISFWGAMALGASSGLIAAPCTTPVLTSILAYIAKTQSIGMGMALMLAFSLGLGTLLLVVATFAGFLQILPRSGRWMKSLKVVSGLLLLAVAEYLAYRAGTLGGV